VFGGNVTEFLKGGEIFVGDAVHDLLDQQFHRLSELEREIMHWLAIEREVVSLDTLQEDIVWQVSRTALLEALGSLRHRSMIESSGIALFTLQPVIMEFVTNRFVERVSKEIETETIELFESHALIKAQAKDYVRDSQIRLILTPIVKQLHSTFGKDGIEKKLKNMLSSLREKDPQKPGYAAGNALNILIHLQCNLRGYDFSHLTVRQAYLQHVDLPEVNFAYSNLARSVFTETFGIILSVAFSPDGELLAAGTANSDILLWQTSGGIPILTFQGTKDWIRSVAFSPDGQLLASGSSDHTIRLWEVGTGKCLTILEGHTNWIWPVAFSPDGSLLASSSGDQTIRLWEASSGYCLKTLEGHTQRVYSVAFSPDGTTLAGGSADGIIMYWDVQTDICLKTLRSNRPYEHMNISNVTGLTDTQKATLRVLGAVEDE
jgi:WD domain, G-beta repeat